jgi:hypothetical protein
MRDRLKHRRAASSSNQGVCDAHSLDAGLVDDTVAVPTAREEGEVTDDYGSEKAGESDDDDEDDDGVQCTVCGDLIGPDDAKYKTTNSHAKCG